MSDHVIGNILEARKTLSGIFDDSRDELFQLGLTQSAVDIITKKKYDKEFVDNELKLISDNDISIVTLESMQYPKHLKLVNSPPVYLYVRGDISCLSEFCVGIVGSRRCSRPAADFTYETSHKLASVGITVVSGFAYGIDIASHRGAMRLGATACILGSGLLNIYPQKHEKYIDEILAKGGCFISEFRLKEEPLPVNFPRRNRIISGLSNALIVIEANKKSGSLITVRYAKEQGRIVYAVPTFPYSHHNACNSLIKFGEAQLLESYLDIVNDFADDLKSSIDNCSKGTDSNTPQFETEIERQIFEALMIEALDINELCIKLNTSIIEILSVVTTLEMSEYITKTDSDKYIAYRREDG